MNKNVVIELGLNLDITWLKGIEKIMKVVKMRFIIWKKKIPSLEKTKTKIKANMPERT